MNSINLDTLIAISRERHADLLREAEMQQLLQQNKTAGNGKPSKAAQNSQAEHGGSASAFAVATRGKPA